MRNLKKILALALALVMTLSLVTVANAFTDDKDFTAQYTEAAEVLAGLKVLKGYTDGSFAPKGEITRAEVAATVYRIVTGDVNDKQVSIYADYNKFDDVKSTKWYAGYVNYCANAGLIKGRSAKVFDPEGKVTGYEALAIILRAVGYGQNGEFEGAGWDIHTASQGQKLGVLKNINQGTLGVAATREMVAEIIFQTIATVDQTVWTPSLGYYLTKDLTLGEQTFGLKKNARTTIDEWGRPGYTWTATKVVPGTVAVIEEAPVATYTTAVTECKVAEDAKFTGTKTYDLYVNAVKTADVLQATDTVDTIGAQGRLTEVYADRIVMIDTLLALVTDVKAATYDAAGHLKTPSKITLAVYDANTTTAAVGDTYVMSNGATNYEYVPGNMVLLNAYTVSGNRDTAGVVSKDAVTNAGEYGEILGTATSVDGTQTVVWFNTGKHTVNGATYDDAAELHLDEAQAKTNNYTWFFDQYGNIVGSVEIATQYTYAVMTSIWWTNDLANGAGVAKAALKYMDGTDNTVTLSSVTLGGVTKAPRYSIMNTRDALMDFGAYTAYFEVATNAAVNAIADNDTTYGDDLIHGHLFQVATLADGSVALTEVNNGATPTPAHTELATNVAITNRYGYITATEGNVAIDTETKFLVRGTNEAAATYKTYTGLNELPTFKAGAKVDFVLGAGSVADYVFIIGETADSTANSFVLVTGNAYSAVLRTIGGVSYWELTLPVPAEDGSTVTLKVLDTDANMATVPTNVTNLTSISNVGKLFYVATTNGFVAETTGVIEIDNINDGLPGLANTDAVKLTDARMLTGVAGGVINGTVNGWAGCRFNITSSTVVVGALAADMTDKVVYVIYDTRNNDVSKVYVLDINSAINPVVTTIDSLTVLANAAPAKGAYVSTVAFTATATRVSSGTFGGTVTATPAWQKLNEVTGVYENYAGDAFVAGTYRAIITLTVDNAAGQNYSIKATAPISYYGQAGKIGGAFVTDPIVVAP